MMAGIEPCAHPGNITSTNGKADDSLKQTLHQRNQPLLLADDSVVLKCNMLGPEDCWVVQGDVKIEVPSQCNAQSQFASSSAHLYASS